ncbi:MAG: aldehyde dehydrogenase family protein [Steroidobacteraceae bacterium]
MPWAIKNPRSLYIDAQWIKPQNAILEPIINPANEELIGEAPVGGQPEVEAAGASARRAFDKGPWVRMRPQERAALLQKFHGALMRRAAEICQLIIAEAGAPVMLAQFLQFGIPMKHLQFYIDASVRDPVTPLPIDLTPNAQGGKTLGAGVMVREPQGVVAGISAYNFPFFLNLAKVGPALAAGNTLVLKPSPYTPFEALILGEAADEAGLPPGVLNIVTGGADVGELLTRDPRIDMVSFTGSDTVGAAIMAQAAPTLKRVHLELGGKSALIVRQDANLQQAAETGLGGFTVQCGQGCALLTRHLVHNSVRAKYVDLLSSMVRHVKLGDPSDPSVGMGPLIREGARKRVENYVEVGKQEVARLVTGGRRPEQLKKGFYYEPTLFNDVDNRSRLAQEEIFGPVGVVIGFDTDEEAIALANDSKFGLSGGIFSADVGRAYEMALELRTGGVLINGGGGTMSSYAPFGGYKRSGIGREYGIEGLNEFTQIKHISFHGA